MTTVIVEQISPTVERATIEELFAVCGTIKHIEWRQPPTPTAFQSAIIEYAEPEHAQAATFLNNALVGTHLTVTLKKPSQQPPPQLQTPQQTGHAAAASPTSASSPTAAAPISVSPANGHIMKCDLSNPTIVSSREDSLRTIYVGNLSPSVTESMLRVYFSQLGPVIAVKLQSDPSGQSPNRFAFVEFLQLSPAQTALAHHQQILDGRPMKVGPANNPIIKAPQTAPPSPHEPTQDERVRMALDKVKQHIAAIHRKYDHTTAQIREKPSPSYSDDRHAGEAAALLSAISQPPTSSHINGHLDEAADDGHDGTRQIKRRRHSSSDDKVDTETADLTDGPHKLDNDHEQMPVQGEKNQVEDTAPPVADTSSMPALE